MNNTGYNLQLEAAYAASVEAVCKERDTRLAELEQRHTRFFVFFLQRSIFKPFWALDFIAYYREMTETVAAATGQDNPGAVSEHDVNALAAHQVVCTSLVVDLAQGG